MILLRLFLPVEFLSYYPLKQGLKHANLICPDMQNIWFLSYYPLKQGLKRTQSWSANDWHKIFILLSIKTRIETLLRLQLNNWRMPFLSYYPLKQGLKPSLVASAKRALTIFILLSIKTRIETYLRTLRPPAIYLFLSYYPLKQGLKRRMRSERWNANHYFYPTIH